MFKVTFNVTDGGLADALASLGGNHSLRVQRLPDNQEIISKRNRTANATAARVAKKAAKRTGGWGTVRQVFDPTTKRGQAMEIVRSVGVAPFKAGDLVARAEERGISKPAIYSAIYAEIAANRLTKLGYGTYQKTGAGTAEAIAS